VRTWLSVSNAKEARLSEKFLPLPFVDKWFFSTTLFDVNATDSSS
jgi:hypothetical protein